MSVRILTASLISLTVIALQTAGLAEEEGLPALKVVGNRLKTEQGKVVRLQGVNVPSLEWGQGEHLSDGLTTAVDWGANIIRLPLCQARWFGRTKRDAGRRRPLP